MVFETRPVRDLQTNHGKLAMAFRVLPPDEALFVSAENLTTGGYHGYLSRTFPDRKIHQHKDPEKGGLWFWWTPK